MISVKGYAASNAKSSLAPFQFDRRDVGNFDVQIEIKYCGVCHSDLHQARNEWGGSKYPMVPGHEIVGIVIKVGPKVSRYKVGDSVGVGCFVDSCRDCSSCRENLEQYCERGLIGTYNSYEKDGKSLTFGGYSNQIVVDENYVLRIPHNIPLEKAAPLLCAGITLYSPLKHWRVEPGCSVAILGLGGLGHMGVKLAAAMGAEVTVLSTSDYKKEDAMRFGAKTFINTKNTDLNKLTKHFDLILNTVSSNINLNIYLNMLKLDGTMVMLGIADTPSTVLAFQLVGRRRRLAGSMIGGIKETQEMLDFCGVKNIYADIELIPINKINEAYERMKNNDIRYRFVIDNSTI